MNNINYQISSLQEMHNHQTQMSSSSSSSHLDLMSSHNDFLEQMLSSVPSSSVSFPWADDHELPPPTPDVVGHLEEQSSLLMASKQRQNLISNGAAKALMLQQQLLLSSGLCSPMGGTGNGLLGDHNDVVGGSSKLTNAANDASIKSLFNGSFSGSLGQISNQPQNFHHHQGGALEGQNYGSSVEAAATASVGGAAGQPKQRVRARRGQATDPHSIAERLRRERIAERMKGLQELVPNANKTDKASMLDEIIDYVKFLQLQVKVLSMSRLGGAAAVSPLVADISSSKGKSGNGTKTNNNDGVTVTEQQVAKLLEEDMGSAMQYLQGKGLCLMPISLATAISTATSHSKNVPMAMNNLYSNGISKSPVLNGESGPPTSPSMSALTVQSASRGGNSGGEIS